MQKGTKVLLHGYYVDDSIKVSSCPQLRKMVDDLLGAKFKMTHEGTLQEFIGMECGWHEDSNGDKYFGVC